MAETEKSANELRAAQIGPDPSLLLLDDDEPFLRRLARAMEKRGFSVETAETVAEAKRLIAQRPPAYGVFDLRPCCRCPMTSPPRPTTPCRPTGCAGNISSGCSSCATAMSAKPRGG